MAETLSVTDMLPNKFEPKRSYRWILALEGIDSFLVSEFGRPSFSFKEQQIQYMGSYRYVAGKMTISGAESIKLHDPIAPSGAQQVMEWIRTHYESVSGRAGYADFYKRDMQLKLLDPVGTVIELWDFKGVQLTKVDFGNLSYNNDDSLTITIGIKYDTCVLQF